jgi:hypothetical protein
MPERTSGGAARRPSPEPRPVTAPEEPGDEFLAAVLIRMWALASGRILRRDVPPDQLSTEELIEFWADDMTPPSGRHARLTGPGPVDDTPAAASAARATPRSRGKARRRPPSSRDARDARDSRDTRGRQERPADPVVA